MEKVPEFLKENEYENLFIIRGILNSINGFKIHAEYSLLRNVNNLFTLWEDEKASAIRRNELHIEGRTI